MAVGNVTGNAPAACLSCGKPLSGVRPARYCSVQCRVRAHRRRHQIPAAPDAQIQPKLRRKLRPLDVLYECGGCGEVYLNERRCEDCNRFCKRLGVALECPHCSEPISLEALLEAALEGMPS